MLRNRLKHWRHRMEIDQKKEFAKFLGVTREQVSLWESQKKQPSIESAWKIKQKLNCTLDDLFEWIDDGPE